MAQVQTETLPYTDIISVWLIDDDEDFSVVASAALGVDSNVQCDRTFGNCEEAIEALRHTERKPDVILLDIGLPGMSGLDGIEPMKRLSPASHIIMLTIYDHDRNIMQAVAAGASGYMLKASKSSEVVAAIQAAMGGGVPMHPAVVQKLLRMFAIQDLPKVDYGITPKEHEVLRFVVEGNTIETIADSLNISFHTVDTHIKHIYAKLDVHTRSTLATKVLKERLI